MGLRTGLVMAGVAMVAGSVMAMGQPGGRNQALVDQAQADLAHRLNVKVAEVKVAAVKPITWTNGALGLPQPGRMYTMALVPGASVQFTARGRSYRYHVGGRVVKYAGPEALEAASMLVILPVEREANLNGDLYQVSFTGANPRKLASSVQAIYPQRGGLILATRRTSRSGFDMVAVTPDARERKLLSAFYVGTAGSGDGYWAAAGRPGLGSGEKLVVGKLDGTGEPRWIDMPAGAPMVTSVGFASGHVVVAWSKDLRRVKYAMPVAGGQWKATDLDPWEDQDLMLNKSESLDISSTAVDGKPGVRIATVWFTGDRKEVATLAGFTLRGFTFFARQLVVAWGEKDGHAAYATVDIRTGEVLEGLPGVTAAAPYDQPLANAALTIQRGK